VSSSSLEQWLQASPKNSTGEISIASDRSFSDVASSGHSPPPPPFRQGTPPINKGTKTASPSIPRPATPVPGTVVSSEIQREKSDRELTEDERFMMDYGDINDGRANGHLGEDIGGERTTLLGNNRAYSPCGDPHGSDSLPP
jgi:hypothetical protein